MKKELLESLLKLVPAGYSVEFEIKGTKGRDLMVLFIRFNYTDEKVEITLADEYNLGV